MKAVIISDTHDNIFAIDDFIKSVENEDFEILIHAGDIVAPFSLRKFEKIPCKKYFVFGNNDGEKKILREIAQKSNITLDDVLELNLNKKKILIYHGTYKSLLDGIIKSEIYDIVIYGHTHRLEITKRGKSLIINPGELCGYLTGNKTYVILDLKTLDTKVVKI